MHDTGCLGSIRSMGITRACEVCGCRGLWTGGFCRRNVDGGHIIVISGRIPPIVVRRCELRYGGVFGGVGTDRPHGR
jgi:hypothetical protein